MDKEFVFPAFPVIGWQVGPVEDLNGVVVITVRRPMDSARQPLIRNFFA